MFVCTFALSPISGISHCTKLCVRREKILYAVLFLRRSGFTAGRILNCIEPVLRKDNRPGLMQFLDLIHRASKYASRQATYLQLVSLLTGQITLRCFFQNARINPDNFHFDTHKIARNLGLADEAEPMLSALCQFEWSENFLEYLAEKIGLPRAAWGNDRTNVSADKLRVEAAHIIYQRSVQHEKYAKKLEPLFLSGHENTLIRRTGEISFWGFFILAHDKLSISQGDYHLSLLLTTCLT